MAASSVFVLSQAAQNCGQDSNLLLCAQREECEQNMHEAIQLHINGIIEDRENIPASHSFAEYMAV
ncbi:MAG: hypothetical protein A2096_09515 [Spirochaetes bacterium GWF1_41_5]|nr:MAG: hypothetical protein A2096_09515 [Spirochaetes bacterium GWF1_41_5]